MEKYKQLAKSNLKKAKGQYISFALLILLAALMLHCGLLMKNNFYQSFEGKWKSNQVSDAFAVLNEEDASPALIDAVKQYSEVKQFEQCDCITLNGSMKFNDSAMDIPLICFPNDSGERFTKVGILDGDEILYDGVYASIFLKCAGYKKGEYLEYKTSNHTYKFKIQGFVEDMQYGNTSNGYNGIYCSEKVYTQLTNEVKPEEKSVHLGVKLKDPMQGKKVAGRMSELFGKQAKNLFGTYYYENCRQVRTMSANIFVMMLVLFAVVVIVITLLVCSFRIRNTIEEEMKNMGALKALGYTSLQIIASMVVPYTVVAIIASVAGSFLTYAIKPILANMIEAQSAFRWEQGLDVPLILITSIIVPLLICLGCIFSARKIRKIPPIEAMRNGTKTHSFKKNRFKTDASILPVNAILAFKNALTGGFQNVLLYVVMVAITFTAIFAGVMHYNMVSNANAFIYALVETKQSATFVLDGTKNKEIQNEIAKQDNVKQALFFGQESVLVNGENIAAFITEDFSKMDVDFVYEGRNAKHSNEVVVGSEIKEKQKLHLGDKIKMTSRGKTVDYIVTGFMQSVNAQGNCVAMTEKAMQKMKSDYEPSELYVYLKDENKTKQFIKDTETTYKNQIVHSVNATDSIEGSLVMFKNIAKLTCTAIAIVIAVLIFAILYMMVKTTIIRSKTQYGIQKALGFTTNQLMFQMALGYVPIFAAGILTGAIVGKLCVNDFILMMFKGLGVYKLGFFVGTPRIIILSVLILALSFIIAFFIARRLKKISAYGLIVE